MDGSWPANLWMPAPARLPLGVRVYAIADIHGRADLLQTMLETIDTDLRQDETQDKSAIIVFLGDYIDRGPRSRRVLDLLTHGLPNTVQPFFLRGNHEQLMLDFLDGKSDSAQWLLNGGANTLTSYGIDVSNSGFLAPSTQDDLREQLLRALPERHMVFLRDLRPSLHLGGYFFVHAGVRPGVALERQCLDDLIWIRAPFLNSQDDFGAVVVHGHTVLSRPLVLTNRIALDTGAQDSGLLTCGVFEGGNLRFLQTPPLQAPVSAVPLSRKSRRSPSPYAVFR